MRILRTCWLGLAGTVLAPGLSRAQALVLTALSPRANAVAMPVAGLLTASFSQPLLPGAGAALRVFSAQRGGLRTRGATPAQVSGNALEFAPGARRFAPGETLWNTVTRAAAGGGGALAAPYVWQATAAVGGTGRGSFAISKYLAVPDRPTGVALGDLDGDNDLDLLVALDTGGAAAVFVNDGAGGFLRRPDVPMGNGPWQVALGDVNGDGTLDLLSANFNEAVVGVRFGDGTGAFGARQAVSAGSSSTGNYPQDLKLGDLDGDGDLDLVAASFRSTFLSVRLNNGAGEFGSGREVPVERDSRGVALGDVDNDGDLDLVTANFDANSASVRLNDGTARFGGTQNVAVGPEPTGLALGDVDNDGDLDLLVANSGGATASVRLNDGAGIFGGGREVAVGAKPYAVVLGDADADGDLDLFTATSSANSMSVRLNNGAGVFGGTREPELGGGPRSLALGDVDGDGDLDAVAGSPGSGGVSVLLNGGTGLGTAPAAAAPGFYVVPNPAHGPVALVGVRAGQLVQVFDGLGREVARTLGTGSGPTILPLPANLRAGFYAVRCSGRTARLVLD